MMVTTKSPTPNVRGASQKLRDKSLGSCYLCKGLTMVVAPFVA